MDNYLSYSLNLIKSCIDGTVAEEIPDDIDVDQLMRFAQFHKIDSIIAFQLLKKKLPKEKAEKINSIFLYNINVDAQQEYSLNQVCKNLSDNKIWFMPMKGSVVKLFYPLPCLRQMCDLDILIDPSKLYESRDVMIAMGCTMNEETLGECNDDTYYFNNVIIELHRHLARKDNKWEKACMEIEKSLVKKTDYEYKMPLEELYVYLLIHMAKHIDESGIGIRSIIDIWLFNKKYGNNMDENRVKSLLEFAGLIRFECSICELAEYWFEQGNCSETINALSDYISESGWVGTLKQKMSTDIVRLANGNGVFFSKVKYYVNIIFLPFDHMAFKYPILKKAPVLLPFCWLHRIINAIVNKRGLINVTVKRLKKADMDDGIRLSQLRASIGL